MALLCIPVPRLVSFTFSTIPICPFLIQNFFSFTCNYIGIVEKVQETSSGYYIILCACAIIVLHER